jgi:hypothetical protein
MAWGVQAACAAAILAAAAAERLAGDAMADSGHAPHWLIDPQTGCYVFYDDPHPADLAAWSGACVDRMASGVGTATFTVRGRFVESVSGTFVKGAAEGSVRANWADGAHFEGTAAAGRFNGQGVLTTAEGDRFEGQWASDRLNGHGTVVWANGDRYDGEWRDSKASGRGTQVWADGRKYEGEWENDRPNGQGVLTRKDGSRVEGEFVDGEPKAAPASVATAAASNMAEATLPKPAVTSPAQSQAAAVPAPNAPADTLPLSTAHWLQSYAGQKLVAVDGSRMAVALSANGAMREVTPPDGGPQKTYFTFLNSRQGTVSDAADAAHVAGLFRLTDVGLAVDFADGHSELLAPNPAGGLFITTTSPARTSYCTAWYREGYAFSAADREAALAAYASRLGVADAKHTAASGCAAPAPSEADNAGDVSKKDAARRKTHGDRSHRDPPAKTAALVTDDPGAMQTIAVRSAQIHPLDGLIVPQPADAQMAASGGGRDSSAPDEPSRCLSVEADGANWGFRNHCGFAVQFAYCVMPANGNASNACGTGAVAGAVPADSFGVLFPQASLREAEYDFRWIACAGAGGNVVPRLVRTDPPAGQCVRVRAS